MGIRIKMIGEKIMREKVLEVLNEINPDIVKNQDEDLLKAGFIDSFEIINIVMALEQTFSIEIDPELIISTNFQTIDSIVEMLKKIR